MCSVDLAERRVQPIPQLSPLQLVVGQRGAVGPRFRALSPALHGRPPRILLLQAPELLQRDPRKAQQLRRAAGRGGRRERPVYGGGRLRGVSRQVPSRRDVLARFLVAVVAPGRVGALLVARLQLALHPADGERAALLHVVLAHIGGLRFKGADLGGRRPCDEG